MALPLIGYRSMLRESTTTVTDPGTASGFSVAGLYDLKAYGGWKSDDTAAPINIDIDAGAGGADADYIALVNHNLATLGATIQILAEGSSPPTVEVLAEVTPTEDTVTYIPLDTQPGATRYWRVVLDHASPPFTSAPRIGEMFLGLKTELPEYLAPTFDPFFKQVQVKGSRSEGGHFLGATLRGQTHRAVLEFGQAGAVRSAFTNSLNAFIDNHAFLRRPFVFVLDTDDSDFAVARYIRVPDDDEIRRLAVGRAWSRLTLELPVEEAFAEAA